MIIELMAVAHLATAAAVLNEHNTNNEQHKMIVVNQRAIVANQETLIRLDSAVKTNQEILIKLVK